MKYLHTMVRVTDLDASLAFYCDKLGLIEVKRKEVPAGRFTLVFLAAPGDESAQSCFNSRTICRPSWFNPLRTSRHPIHRVSRRAVNPADSARPTPSAASTAPPGASLT